MEHSVNRAWLLAILLMLCACADSGRELPATLPLPEPLTNPVSFSHDVKPILENKCLACHGCFDAPCQLKLETFEGLERGGHKLPAYGGMRTEAQQPTRLGLDAQNAAQWRSKGFHSLLEAQPDGISLLEKMLAHGKSRPFTANEKLPEKLDISIARSNTCVANSDEFDEFAKKHPWAGMPFGTSGLTDTEFATLTGWLRQGAPNDSVTRPLTSDEQQAVANLEKLFNGSSNREQLVARWLYEHLFLAHLYFSDISGEVRFFELVRSKTPSGKPIEVIATVRPNDDPQQEFFYRVRPIQDTIVHKRHITYQVNAEKIARIKTLFFSGNWEVAQLPAYNYRERSNPFATFSAIPAHARYQFMLDDAEYFTRTFIRGPVCRGQIATDVIRDHFWTLFQHPAHDLYITDAEFREQATPLLALPGQDDDLVGAKENWNRYRDKRNDYQSLRNRSYNRLQPQGASLQHIWDGDGFNHNALLTIFRHHDSASVVQGLVGAVPETIWWMDYPLFERTYYELVVNFDVFGNVAHQLQTRLYFDLIRNGSELNFLRLIPDGQRSEILNSWYQGMGKWKLDYTYENVDDTAPSAVNYLTREPQAELALMLLDTFAPINRMATDPINRCQGNHCGRADQAPWIQAADRTLAALSARPASQLPGILQLPETSFLRVVDEHGERTLYTLIRNRAHSNVAFLTGENLRYLPEQDTLTIYPGIVGSYPNFMFEVPATLLPVFAQSLAVAADEQTFEQLVTRWGIRRTHPQFWQYFHDLSEHIREREPLEAGVLDMNRYENL